MCFFQNDVYTGFQSGMEKGEKSKPKTAGSPGSCMRGIRFRKAFSGECGIGGKPLIHLLDHGRICAFLRTETALHPCEPQSGFVTSQAIRNVHSFSSGSAWESEITARSFKPRAP